VQEFRLAIRALRTTPIVSAVAVVSLALGIGANTAIFSLVNSLMLRALPVKEPDRLVLVTNSAATGIQPWSYPVWEQIRERRQLFDGTMAWFATRFDLASGGETQFVDGLEASGSFFDVLGVRAIIGRTFSDADDRRGGGPDGPVAVISYRFWQRRFGGSAGAVGHTLSLDRVSFTIVGVTPPEFSGPDVGRPFDVAVPLGDEPLLRRSDTMLDRLDYYWLTTMARLRPEQTLETAAAGLRGVQTQIRNATLPRDWPKVYLDQYLRDAFALVPAATGNSRLRFQYARPLLTIMVAVGLVLIIACANIANLLLARATVRRHELSVRRALGASRWRLVRQLLAESVLLAAVGAAGGLLIASWGSRLLVRQLSTPINPVFLDLSIDGRVLAFAVGVTVVTVLLFGTAPAFHASGVVPTDALKDQTRGTVGEARGGLASGLVVAQVALSVVLVVAAGLFVRTFWSLVTRPLGFEQSRVLLVMIDAQRATVDPRERLLLYARAREAVRALPGVAEAAVSLVTPVSGVRINPPIEVSGAVPLPKGERAAFINFITPGWFRTFGTPLLAGRDVEDRDRKGSLPIVVVNQALARKFLNGTSALGHTIATIAGPTARSMEIVGVATDAVYASLHDLASPTVYVPLAQFDGPPFLVASVSLSVRSTGGSPVLLTRSVAEAISAVNPELALTFRPMADQVDGSLTQERVVAMLSGCFGVLALILAALGVYGVTAYAVARRRSEIAIRMALGAAPFGVVRLVLVRVSILVAVGIVTGGAVSLWASRFVASLVYGLEPRDPSTFVGASMTLIIVAALAGWLPARRAARLDPAEVLRES
jgi:putative ABC transport system permease protein